jgi:tetratricopeptide (TPR) repeat protein
MCVDVGMISRVAPRDFFISYTSADRAWAEWIAWELEEAGYTTLIQAWDFRPGMNFVTEMQKGAAESSRTLIVLSKQFLESGFTQAEWTSAFSKDPAGENGLLIPVRVAECEPPGLLRARIYIDLVGMRAEEALRRRLLDGVKQGRAKPATRPPIPTSAIQKPTLPAAMRRTIQNLPFQPNPTFTGRDTDMEKLGKVLQNHGQAETTQIVVLHGLGGVGKTQLAVEYAWKHLGEYDAVFWMKADRPEALDTSLVALAQLLGLPEVGEREQAVQIKAVLDWLNNHERWLLIADNADTDAATKAVFKRLSPSLIGHLLITSRISDWPVNIQDLILDVLSPDDATRYLLDRVARKRHNAGGDPTARGLAQELGHLPLALEQAASFIVEMRWSYMKYQDQFRDARLEILSEGREGGTHYPTSVAKTWSITLEELGPLARALLRIAAWFAPDAIPREIFSANKEVLLEVLTKETTISDLAIEKALVELDRFSLVRLTSKTVSVHRLLQAVEQDSLRKEECERWLDSAARLFNALAPRSSDNVSTWAVWLSLGPHAEALLEHIKRHVVDTLPIALMANQFGLFLYARGAYTQVEPLYQRSLTIREKALGPEHPDVAQSLNNLAVFYAAQGQYAQAEPICQRALAIREKALGLEHPDVAQSLNNLATLSADQGQYAQAAPLYKQALAVREKTLDPEHPDIAYSLNGLAVCYNSQGQYTKAETLYKQALAIREKVGLEDPEVAASLDYLGTLYADQDQSPKAETLYRQALTIREKALGPEHPDMAKSLDYLATLYADQGQYPKAETLYRQALTIRERALGPERPEVARSLNYLAALYLAQDQYPKGESLYERALAIREKVMGPEHPDVAKSLYHLAELYLAQGQYAKAEPICQRALAIREKALGSEHPDVATSLENYAYLLQKLCRPEEATRLESRARVIRAKRI